MYRYSLIFVLLNYLKNGCLRCLRAAYIENDLDIKVDKSKDSSTTTLTHQTIEDSPGCILFSYLST